MKEFEFELVIEGVRELTEEVEQKLFEAGCDDATLSIRQGVAYAEFCRKADSLKKALLSAIRNVRRAGYRVIRVDQSDLVTPADIARRTKRTRQAISNYISGQRGPGDFPPPTFGLKSGDPRWTWSSVAAWMAQNDILPVEEQSKAEMIAITNNALEASRQRKKNPALSREIFAAVG